MIEAARRILILAPHPDDEVVACGIAAMRARAAGARVFVLYLTTGVPEPAALWPWRRRQHAARMQRRLAEAREAAIMLDLTPARWLDIPSRRLRWHLDKAAAAAAETATACAADAVWVPAFEGGHQDHDAANALAASLSDHLPVCEFAAYNFAGGRVHANEFPEVHGEEIAIVAGPAEMARKQRALACYASERGNLAHVGATRETCRLLPTHDYGRAPHPGRLFRERFHWVPIRHPRVDFAVSAEVYRDIGGWTLGRLGRRGPPFGDTPSGETRQPDREFAGAFDEPQRQRHVRR